MPGSQAPATEGLRLAVPASDIEPTGLRDELAPDLFAAAGIMLEEDALKNEGISRPTRPRRDRSKTGSISHKPEPAPLPPAARAAAGRLEGARRSRGPTSPGQRARVGAPRCLVPAPVLAFPLAKNAGAVAEVIERLPHGYAPDLNKKRDAEVRRLQKKLMHRGVQRQAAWQCAREVVHVAYIARVTDAHKEAGIL